MCIVRHLYTHSIRDDDYKIVETLKIKTISIFGVTIVFYLIKILSGYRKIPYVWLVWNLKFKNTIEVEVEEIVIFSQRNTVSTYRDTLVLIRRLRETNPNGSLCCSLRVKSPQL